MENVLLFTVYCVTVYWIPCFYSKGRTLAIVLGSGILDFLIKGGHSSEMVRLIQHVSPLYVREYILAQSDTSSINKILEPNPSVHYIQRPREVGQSFLSSLWPLLKATLETGYLFWKIFPDAVMGSCIHD